MYRYLILLISYFLINTSAVANEKDFLLTKLLFNSNDMTLVINGKNNFQANINCKNVSIFPKITILENKNFNFIQADINKICSGKNENIYYTDLNIPINFTLPNNNEPFFLKMRLSLPMCNQVTNECIITESIISFDSTNNNSSSEPLTAIDEENNYSENFIYALLLAFIGGIILNFMPCVLPIIAMKINSFNKIGQQERNMVIKKSFATLFGIIVSYIVIAFITIYLKRIGENFGYGFFFQNSSFIILISIALIIYGSSLLGHEIFSLPSSIATRLHNLTNKNSITGDFLTGCFASLMSTPCSAPFITTATAFAISAANDLQITLIFISIGLGLGIIYLLIIFAPRIVTYLPKPGAWQYKFNKVLAALIYLSFFAFIYILSTQIGLTSSIILLMLMILLKFFIETKIIYWLKISLIIITLALSFKLPFIYHQEQAQQEILDHSLWHNFSQSQIDEELSKNRTIFIDITASWCATCQINKFIVLDNRAVVNFFKKKNVYLIRYDASNALTNEVKNFLAPYRRYGVPINIVIGPKLKEPKNKNGLLLPILLSPNDIYKTINAVSGN